MIIYNKSIMFMFNGNLYIIVNGILDHISVNDIKLKY